MFPQISCNNEKEKLTIPTKGKSSFQGLDDYRRIEYDLRHDVKGIARELANG